MTVNLNGMLFECGDGGKAAQTNMKVAKGRNRTFFDDKICIKCSYIL